jgi:hypothetical protein
MKIPFREYDFRRVCDLEYYLIESDSNKRKIKRLLSKLRDLFFL